MWQFHRRLDTKTMIPKYGETEFCVFKDILDDEDPIRPKSAPARNGRARAQSAGCLRGRTTPLGYCDKNETLEDTMSRFHTTDRVLKRMKERRRTEADIIVNEKPAGQIAMELPARRLSKMQAENVTARVCQPTAASSARFINNKRRNPRDIYVPPKQIMRVQYYKLDNNRFKGNRPLSGRAVQSLVDRLSQYDTERRPPDSARSQSPDQRRQLGPLASYRWKGLKNC